LWLTYSLLLGKDESARGSQVGPVQKLPETVLGKLCGVGNSEVDVVEIIANTAAGIGTGGFGWKEIAKDLSAGVRTVIRHAKYSAQI
jgi:hypothetical protein